MPPPEARRPRSRDEGGAAAVRLTSFRSRTRAPVGRDVRRDRVAEQHGAARPPPRPRRASAAAASPAVPGQCRSRRPLSSPARSLLPPWQSELRGLRAQALTQRRRPSPPGRATSRLMCRQVAQPARAPSAVRASAAAVRLASGRTSPRRLPQAAAPCARSVARARAPANRSWRSAEEKAPPRSSSGMTAAKRASTRDAARACAVRCRRGRKNALGPSSSSSHCCRWRRCASATSPLRRVEDARPCHHRVQPVVGVADMRSSWHCDSLPCHRVAHDGGVR